MDKRAVFLVGFLFCTIFLSTLLQGIGLLTPYWITGVDCDARGLFYSCCLKGSLTDCNHTALFRDNVTSEIVSNATEAEGCRDNKESGPCIASSQSIPVPLGLEATSFCFLLLSSLLCLMAIFCMSLKKQTSNFYANRSLVIMVILYPLAGLFSILGCIIISAEYTSSSHGYSFSLCLTSGCYVLFQVIVVCVFIYHIHKSKRSASERYTMERHANSHNTDIYSIEQRRETTRTSADENPNQRNATFRGAQFAVLFYEHVFNM